MTDRYHQEGLRLPFFLGTQLQEENSLLVHAYRKVPHVNQYGFYLKAMDLILYPRLSVLWWFVGVCP